MSRDENYSNLNAADVSVTNTDNDVAGITVNPTSGLTTTEAGGTATLIGRASCRARGEISVGAASIKIKEGTVAPASLTVTTANWNVAQTVRGSGVRDVIEDGNIA